MKISEIQQLVSMMQKPASTVETPQAAKEAVPEFELDDDGEEYMGVGVNGLLAASEKLIAINKGLVDQDERDSLMFQKVFRLHSLLRESIKMDAGKVARTAMYQAARRRNLKGLTPAIFDAYVERQLVGNPLTSPLEEINPMQLVENARRITKMGPGGLGSSRSITEESQSIHPSQFGFISVIEGPECTDDQSFIYTDKGWVPAPEVTMDHKIATELNGEMVFQSPSRVIHEEYTGTMYTVNSKCFSFCCTPSHRCIGKKFLHCKTGVWPASELHTKKFFFPVCHLEYAGRKDWKVVDIGDKTFDIEDWCELVGWFLSEGSLSISKCKTKLVEAVRISQNQHVHPDEFNRIVSLVTRMGLNFGVTKDNSGTRYPVGTGVYVYIKDRAIRNYFSQYKYKCYHKWIPEELFDAPLAARKKMYEAMMLGDGCYGKTNCSYTTVSERLQVDFDRLCTSIGLATTKTIRKDKRPRVKTTNYTVSVCKPKFVSARNGAAWIDTPYASKVHCVTVPTGKIIIRRDGKLPIISGNSERAGIDVRITRGVRIGSNGRLYQKMRNFRTKQLRWMSPKDLSGLTTKIPD